MSATQTADTLATLHALLRAAPFRRFRLHTRRAGLHVVSDPADALLTRTALHVVRTRGTDGIADALSTLPLAQVAAVEVEPA